MSELSEKDLKFLERKYSEELEKYMSYEYPVIIHTRPEYEYKAVIEDLPGCVGYGVSEQDAIKDLDANKRVWFLITFMNGVYPLPPDQAQKYLKVQLTMKRDQFKRLVYEAELLKISFNDYVLEKLTSSYPTEECLDLMRYFLDECDRKHSK